MRIVAKFGRVLIIALILVIFGAIFFFPVSAGGGPSPTTHCISNLKQCALGAAMYAADENDHYMRTHNWIDVLGPYTKNESLFRCPSLKEQGFGYAMNKYAESANPTTPDADQKPLLWETSDLTRNASQYLPLYPVPPRHSNTVVVAYMDSHVKAILTQPAK